MRNFKECCFSYLPSRVSDLTTCLSDVNRDDFAHCNGRKRQESTKLQVRPRKSTIRDGDVRSFGRRVEIKEGMGMCVCVCVCVCVGRAKGWDSLCYFVCGMCFCVAEFPGARTHFRGRVCKQSTRVDKRQWENLRLASDVFYVKSIENISLILYCAVCMTVRTACESKAHIKVHIKCHHCPRLRF